MNKTKKTAMMVAGSMVALGVVAYYMMPREGKHNLMNMMNKMTSNSNCNNSNCNH